MSDPRVARRLVGVTAGFNVAVGALYFILGCGAISVAAYNAEVEDGKVVSTEFVAPGLRAILFTSYGIFLFACGVGLWRERPWGWYFGLVAGGLSFLVALLALTHGSWGAAAFDAVYGSLLIGSLVHLRRS